MVSIGNVAINVSDLERSERFYVDALGLEVLSRIDTSEVREVIVGTPGEGSQLMLAKHTTAHLSEPQGIWKVFLFTGDAAALYARAITAGAEPVEPPKFLEQFSVTIAFVKDPDGYLLELGQQRAASPSRSPRLLARCYIFDVLERRRLDRVEHGVLLLDSVAVIGPNQRPVHEAARERARLSVDDLGDEEVRLDIDFVTAFGGDEHVGGVVSKRVRTVAPVLPLPLHGCLAADVVGCDERFVRVVAQLRA